MKTISVVSIKNFKQQFGKTIVLKNINLEIKKGEILGILGPSGSGKTTLIKAIVGMNIATEGEVLVLEQKMPSLKIVDNIGYMAQADALYEDLNAYENLLFFGSLYGVKGKKAKERVNEVLKVTDLLKDIKKPVKNFSGGMKRRLSLSIALFHSPDILILDEPTVGIDPVLRRQFWEEFHRLRDMGKTIILTTHVMDEATNCDRLALIREGNIIATGTPDDLKELSFDGTIEGVFLNDQGVNL